LDERAERVKVFSFIDSQKTEFDIKTLCDVCEVPRSSCYDWTAGPATGAADACWDEAVFENQVYDIWVRSRGRYGVPRVTATLWRAGVQANHKRVERVMVELGGAGKAGRRKVRTTVRDPKAELAPDLVKRDFNRGRPDELWIGDLTYIPTDEGWLYVTSVLDAGTRRLLGWSITDHMRAEACCDASKQLWPHAAGPGSMGWCSIPTTEPPIPATTTGFCARICISLSRWALSVIRMIMLWLRVSGRPLNENSSMTPIIEQKKRPEHLYSNGWSGIIVNGCTPRLGTARQRNTNRGSSRSQQRRSVSDSRGDVQLSPGFGNLTNQEGESEGASVRRATFRQPI
jgi:hypothetical protein